MEDAGDNSKGNDDEEVAKAAQRIGMADRQ